MDVNVICSLKEIIWKGWMKCLTTWFIFTELAHWAMSVGVCVCVFVPLFPGF